MLSWDSLFLVWFFCYVLSYVHVSYPAYIGARKRSEISISNSPAGNQTNLLLYYAPKMDTETNHRRHSWTPRFKRVHRALTQVSFWMICKILLAGSKKSIRHRRPSPRYCLSTTLKSCQRTVEAVAVKGRYRADKVLWMHLSKDSAS